MRLKNFIRLSFIIHHQILGTSCRKKFSSSDVCEIWHLLKGMPRKNSFPTSFHARAPHLHLASSSFTQHYHLKLAPSSRWVFSLQPPILGLTTWSRSFQFRGSFRNPKELDHVQSSFIRFESYCIMYQSLLEGICQHRVRGSEGCFGRGGKREPATRGLGGFHMHNVVLANKQSDYWHHLVKNIWQSTCIESWLTWAFWAATIFPEICKLCHGKIMPWKIMANYAMERVERVPKDAVFFCTTTLNLFFSSIESYEIDTLFPKLGIGWMNR